MKNVSYIFIFIFGFKAIAGDLDTCCFYAKQRVSGESTCGLQASMEKKFAKQVKNFGGSGASTILLGQGRVQLVSNFPGGQYKSQVGATESDDDLQCFAYLKDNKGEIAWGQSSATPAPAPSPFPFPLPIPFPFPQPHPQKDLCDIDYTGSYYYVSKNGQRFSDYYSQFSSADSFMRNLLQSHACRQKSIAYCSLEFTGSYYYIAKNNSRFSDHYSQVNNAFNALQAFQQSRVCGAITPRPCSIEYTGSYYYVARSGSRISEYYSQLGNVQSFYSNLRASRVCY